MNRTTERKKTLISYIAALLGFAAAVTVDQVTKYLAEMFLKNSEPIVLIDGVFQLRYLENRGAAFGILQGRQIFFYIITVLILVLVVAAYIRIPAGKKYFPLRFCAVMIASGAAGNFADRIRLNYVVDFFYFKLINFPVFNVADIFVTVSAVVLAVLLLFYYKEDDLEQIFHSR